MSNLFWLTDAQMARLRPFFPRSHGKPRVDDRRVLSGIILINRNGLLWCDAPKGYGPAQTLYNRIEIMFGRLKDWRRFATRYDRCPETFFSAIALAATVLFWL
ncbi:transposase [Sedimentitalea sp. XS_ASV28]|uniref:transposase n=1 Tax=Sedimentitalea sp. XS_ASV28 TaxID=3241296 RepID=UPI0035116F0D